MGIPTLKTERLIIREFTENDLEAFYEKQFRCRYGQSCSYHYAICLKEDNYPIGYINIEIHDGNDLGYGLRKEFWYRGIVTEACKAVIKQLERDGIPIFL